MTEIVIGIDLGTQGVRALGVAPDGRLVAQAQVPLRLERAQLPEGWNEQDPREWRRGLLACLSILITALPEGASIAGVCVDSTSGTILPVDADGNPLYAALMYNDQRSQPWVAEVRQAGAALQAKLGYEFSSSYGLPKILWFQRRQPEVFSQTACFLHAADYLAGCLCGDFRRSDTSNALKSGYDLVDLCWPDFIPKILGIPLDKLPAVVLPGTPIGETTRAVQEACGLPAGTPVFAGATDGTAGQIASGARTAGDWNSTLGTTLVFKGISSCMVPDPLGRVYYHRHPEGGWMPGGASNTGTEWIQVEHPGADLDELNQRAEKRLPTSLLRYPLARRGERFPFVKPDVLGFVVGDAQDAAVRFAAGMEGLAFIERFGYELLAEIGLEVGPRVYITGGGARSAVWSRLRASILGKTLVQPEVTETAMGAAILAASGCWFGSVSQSAARMVRERGRFDPERRWEAFYAARYQDFIGELRRRAYIEEARG